MPRRARIALLIDTATTWGTGLIEGIAEYAHAHEDWQFLLGPRGKYDRSLLPADWNGDGIIARITHQELADQVDCLPRAGSQCFLVPVWRDIDSTLHVRSSSRSDDGREVLSSSWVFASSHIAAPSFVQITSIDLERPS